MMRMRKREYTRGWESYLSPFRPVASLLALKAFCLSRYKLSERLKVFVGEKKILNYNAKKEECSDKERGDGKDDYLFAISITEEILQHEDHIGARKYSLWERTPRCSWRGLTTGPPKRGKVGLPSAPYRLLGGWTDLYTTQTTELEKWVCERKRDFKIPRRRVCLNKASFA